MVSWLSTMAFLQGVYETCWNTLNRFRRNYLLSFALRGGRDMLLLRSGQWIDVIPDAPERQILWRYDAETHTLVKTGTNERAVRWPWISVSNDSHDLSDFFGTLRISRGHGISADKAFMLYAHQKGTLPYAEMTILQRDGTEETVHTYDERVNIPQTASEVNYVT